MKTCITALIAILAVTSLQPSEYHVSIAGLDQNSGSRQSPFRTISAAAQVAQPGDVITVHEGVYRERVNPPRGGESDTKRIVYQAASGENVVIKGSEIIKGWEEVQDGVWKVTLPNRFFGHFNPYSLVIGGEWYSQKGFPRHCGTVYLNGEWMDEAPTVERVLAPIGTRPLWKAKVGKEHTTIRAQFKDVDPNAEMVEINVRQCIFYPDRPGRNYITVRGFVMLQAATPWSGAMSEQIGLIGTHWSKGWVIENNVISHSMNTGITLGRYELQGVAMPPATAEGYVRSIELALEQGWSKEKIGSHVVRNNHISHCEKNGIHGSLGGIFSTIEGNTICDIAMRGWIGGPDVAGLKLLGSHDTLIRHNHIYRCRSAGGIWLDWMAQGTRVTGNLLHDNTQDLFVEVNHGPLLVDNNVFLSPAGLLESGGGGAYAHNLFACQIRLRNETRKTPFHKPHSTEMLGLATPVRDDERFHKNLFSGHNGLAVYGTGDVNLQAASNVYLAGAKPSTHERGAVVLADFDPGTELEERPDGWWLQISPDHAWKTQQKRGVVTTESLGRAKIPGAPYERPDGTPYRLERDFFGKKRNIENPAPGPFRLPSEKRMCFKVWPKTKPIRVERLRCEYRDQPLGIDHPAPRLSWILESSVRRQKQTAYRVLVARSSEALRAGRSDLWDSGKVESSQSVNIIYAGKALVSGQRCFWKVKVWDKDGASSDWSASSFWEMGLLKASDWKGHWINDGKPSPEKDADFYRDDPAPLFRRDFRVSGPIRRARLYISALGYVHATLNGRAVGDHHLDPIWTLPNKRVFYSVYDVSNNLEQGDNCLGVTLGNGWYNPLPLRMWGRVNLRERLPVGRPQFIAQLLVDYADGSRESLASDSTWKVAQGPFLRNSIYLGEKVDARKTVKGWDKPGLDDRAWDSARIALAPEGALQAQPLPPIKVTDSVTPIRITEPSDGVYIVDMGQNSGGWARFTFDVPAGTEITMRYGELLYEDGTLNPMTSVCGQIKRKKPGADGSPAVAWQTDTYIARGGGPEVYTPRFTFHAFRYVEITGLPARPSLDDVEGLRMHSAVEPVGSFFCSNQLFNRIQTMCQWTFLSNLFGVQSDCPHRERFGYGGDLVTTSDAFMLNYDMAGFYAKAVRDWHDSALPDGMLTDTAPSVGIQYCGVGWAMAHPHLQVQLYRYYADRRTIEEQYVTSKRWLERVRSLNKDHIIRRGLHDHEALEKEKSPPMITPLYCESARMLSRLARILGKEAEADEYDRLVEDIRNAYVEKFLAPGTGVVGSGIQSVQAFALFLDMLPAEERPAALAHLVRDITDKHDGHLTTGIFGTRYMLDVLSRKGRAEVVSKLVNVRDFPGWGHMLEQGATTLWEHWKFSDNTFSHNHPMFGSVSQWFYNWLGGIEPAVDAVGFDTFTFQPQFIDRLDWVRCTYRSIRGPITCDWKREGHHVVVDLHVPVNATATLMLPTAGLLTENGLPAADSTGVEKTSERYGRPRFRLGSGRYHFNFAPSKQKKSRF